LRKLVIKALVTWLGDQDEAKVPQSQQPDQRRIGGQPIAHHDHLQQRVILAKRREKPPGRVQFAVIFLPAVLFVDGLRHHR
jgi:hypothetical protein